MHNQMYSRGLFIEKGTVYREMVTKSKYSFERETRAMRRRMRNSMKYGGEHWSEKCNILQKWSKLKI